MKTEVKVFENEKEAEEANAKADLAMKKAKWAQSSQVVEVEAKKVVALRDAELQKEVEVMDFGGLSYNNKTDLIEKKND